MKRIVFLTCIGSLALALTAWGAPKERSATKAKGKAAPAAHAVSAKGRGHVAARPAPKRTSRSFSAARSHQRAIASAPPARSRPVARASTPRSSRVETTRARSARSTVAARDRAAVNRERNLARANTLRSSRMEPAKTRNERITQATRAAARNNLAVNRQRNLTFARNVAMNRDRNVRIVNYWRGDRFRGANYAAFYNYNRVWHDRGWWVSNYPRVVFVLGGWWCWNAGYWYPAWGYDPYAYYPYDGPIYGYGDLTPDRVIVNVQVALQEQGYYAGAIDGDLGPQTRGALAAYQADHGLAVTSAVDRPTLQTLGLG
jgi:Putative peptidoglycan binding domain